MQLILLYSDSRTRFLNYIKNYSIMQFRNLMASKKETNIVNLSLYIYHSLRKQESFNTNKGSLIKLVYCYQYN